MGPIHVIDSHTGGEPTRMIVAGGPDLGSGSLADRREEFRTRHDQIRSAVVNEPRGSDVVVGGLLTAPTNSDCAAGVIFFNNVGYLNMCGHGTIGLLVTLAHLGRIEPGVHRIETPVGIVTAELVDSHRVRVKNVPAYRYRRQVRVDVAGHGPVTGDVAWGGNWFFLVADHGQRLQYGDADKLRAFALRIRAALERAGITGADGAEIDHVELFAPSLTPKVDSRNFVLCPGGAYDRSPCGTGTSAKIACLAADGLLAEGELWRQQSIVGSVFEATYERVASEIVPTITGSAYVTAESSLLLNEHDPFVYGIRAEENRDE